MPLLMKDSTFSGYKTSATFPNFMRPLHNTLWVVVVVPKTTEEEIWNNCIRICPSRSLILPCSGNTWSQFSHNSRSPKNSFRSSSKCYSRTRRILLIHQSEEQPKIYTKKALIWKPDNDAVHLLFFIFLCWYNMTSWKRTILSSFQSWKYKNTLDEGLW